MALICSLTFKHYCFIDSVLHQFPISSVVEPNPGGIRSDALIRSHVGSSFLLHSFTKPIFGPFSAMYMLPYPQPSSYKQQASCTLYMQPYPQPSSSRQQQRSLQPQVFMTHGLDRPRPSSTTPLGSTGDDDDDDPDDADDEPVDDGRPDDADDDPLDDGRRPPTFGIACVPCGGEHSGCPNIGAWSCSTVRCADHCVDDTCTRHSPEVRRRLLDISRSERAPRSRGKKGKGGKTLLFPFTRP